ncbi:hypothetical protein JHK84_043787 [Glycine max]|nr:hypothetical protein JHK84_043787 [Glycine max]
MEQVVVPAFTDDLRVPSSLYFPAYAQGHGPPPTVQERFQGNRYSLPNSRIMIHQQLSGGQGGQTDIDIQPLNKQNLTKTIKPHLFQDVKGEGLDVPSPFVLIQLDGAGNDRDNMRKA